MQIYPGYSKCKKCNSLYRGPHECEIIIKLAEHNRLKALEPLVNDLVNGFEQIQSNAGVTERHDNFQSCKSFLKQIKAFTSVMIVMGREGLEAKNEKQKQEVQGGRLGHETETTEKES